MGREYVGQLLDRGARKVYAAARDPRTIDIDDSRVVPLQLDVTDARPSLRQSKSPLTSPC
jgi:NAD(P)-dependent dehydrogenase (short-subunit alcohol dehydrogenase family)